MFAQTSRSLQEPGRSGLALLTALALHAGALLAVALWQAQTTVSPPGEQEITIDLAPAMEALESVAPAEVSAPEVVPVEAEAAPVEDAPEPVEETPEDALEQPPKEIPEVSPVEVTEATASEAVPVEESLVPETVPALDPADAVIAQPLEDKPAPKPVKPPPRKEVERKPAPKPAPKPRGRTAERSPPPADAHRGQASASRENRQGAAASADPTVLNRYVASLAASLRSRLRYPESGRSQGLTGIATVRFSMDRSGRILNAVIVRSAGHPMLDDAALAAARPGSTLPAAPDALPQQQFTLVVPLRFNLR